MILLGRRVGMVLRSMKLVCRMTRMRLMPRERERDAGLVNFGYRHGVAEGKTGVINDKKDFQSRVALSVVLWAFASLTTYYGRHRFFLQLAGF